MGAPRTRIRRCWECGAILGASDFILRESKARNKADCHAICLSCAEEIVKAETAEEGKIPRGPVKPL